MKNWRNTASTVATFILGALFIFSGMIKLQDPVGSGLMVGEYLSFFHFGFLRFASAFAGVFFALLETLVGVALLCGVWKSVVWMVAGGLTAFFTLLTLVLLIFNPSMECGCFGEAIHLTHLQSFLKNIFILLFLALMYRQPCIEGVCGLQGKWRYAVFGVDAAAVVLFAILSLGRLPLVDYTDMKPGVELFSYDNTEGPMLSMYNSDDEYVYEYPGRVIVISSYEKLSAARMERISSFAKAASDLGVTVYSAASHDGLEYTADRRTLMALNRSNGGATYIDDGQVVAKWHNSGLPDAEQLGEILSADEQDLMACGVMHGKKHLQIYLFAVFFLALI